MTSQKPQWLVASNPFRSPLAAKKQRARANGCDQCATMMGIGQPGYEAVKFLRQGFIRIKMQVGHDHEIRVCKIMQAPVRSDLSPINIEIGLAVRRQHRRLEYGRLGFRAVQHFPNRVLRMPGHPECKRLSMSPSRAVSQQRFGKRVFEGHHGECPIFTDSVIFQHITRHKLTARQGKTDTLPTNSCPEISHE